MSLHITAIIISIIMIIIIIIMGIMIMIIMMKDLHGLNATPRQLNLCLIFSLNSFVPEIILEVRLLYFGEIESDHMKS